MEEHQDHLFSYKQQFFVLMVLLCLTGLTVFLSQFDFGWLNIWIALGIAATKATFVLLFFMHMKYESTLIKGTFLTTVVLLAVFIGLMLLDVAFR